MSAGDALPSRQELSTLVCEAGFLSLQGNSLPAYARTGAQLGENAVMFVEQRSWLQFLKLNDVKFRKREKDRNILSAISEAYDLDPGDIFRPAMPTRDGSEARTTVMFSIRGLCAWLLTRVFMITKPQCKDRSAQLRDGWRSCLSGFGRVVTDGAKIAADHGGKLALVVDGVSVELSSHGMLDLMDVVKHVWPSLPTEWDQIRESLPDYEIPMFGTGDNVSCWHLLVAVDMRLRYSAEQVSESHWLWQTRVSLLHIVAYAAELPTWTASTPQTTRHQVRQVLGVSGKRRCLQRRAAFCPVLRWVASFLCPIAFLS